MMYRHLHFQSAIEQPVRPIRRPFRAKPRAAAPECPEVIARFLGRLFSLNGLSVEPYRTPALAKRMPACLRAVRAHTIADALARIEQKPEHAAAALNAVLLGVTALFRDQLVFEQLGSALLPKIRHCFPAPRIWSAACSDGHELYSAALLIAQQGWLDRCELLGTDCRADAIVRSTEGFFAEDNFDRLTGTWPLAQMIAVPGGRQVCANIRAAIRWRQADALAAPEPGPWHLILCRNLAIYLDAAGARRLWENVTSGLVPGGFLVVGKADYPDRHLALRRVAPGIFQKNFAS